MFPRLLVAARAPLAALLIASAMIGSAPTAFADDAKPAEKPAGQEAAKEPQKVDVYAEAQKEVTGPAGNPECVWLGRRVVRLMWRDDLDTAFRHLDLYDRFGCPGGHIQAAFRCLTRFGGQIDPKVAETLDSRVHACWINPNAQPQQAAAAAAAAPATQGSAAPPAPAASPSPSASPQPPAK
jgi:hypothetical protein